MICPICGKEMDETYRGTHYCWECEDRMKKKHFSNFCWNYAKFCKVANQCENCKHQTIINGKIVCEINSDKTNKKDCFVCKREGGLWCKIEER